MGKAIHLMEIYIFCNLQLVTDGNKNIKKTAHGLSVVQYFLPMLITLLG